MAYGNWDEIVKEYNDIYLHSRFAEHARGMLNLIPRLRREAAFSNLIPMTSHGTLVLRYPGVNTDISIWCEKADQEFRVYLYDGNEVSDEILVSDDEIISAIQQYAKKLRAFAGAIEHH